MTNPVASALDRCLTLMTRAAPHPLDTDTWHDTIRQASIILARHAEPPAPVKSFWLVPATLAVGLILGAILHHLT